MEKNLIFNLPSLKKYRLGILVILIGFVGLGIASSFLIKPKYKISSVISISPSYFQNSLMREYLSEVFDPSEIRSLRQSIISEALNRNFLNQIINEEGFEVVDLNSTEASQLRAELLRSIEVISLQSSDFQISVTDGNPERALSINEKVIANILSVLKDKRSKTLINLRDAIIAQLESISTSTNKNVEDLSFTNKENLDLKIKKIEQELLEQKKIFSAYHPYIIEMSNKLDKMKKTALAIENNSIEPSDAMMNSVNTIAKDKSDSNSSYNLIYDDLSRKYRYLNIVLMAESSPQPSYFSVVRSPEIPTSAIWPKKKLFLVWSLMLGFLFSIIYVGFSELMNSSSINPSVKKYMLPKEDFLDKENKDRGLNHDLNF